MKCYCGTDIIEVNRVKEAILKTKGFKEKVFTKKEIAYAEKKSEKTKYEHYAGRFAAKEAIYKAISNLNNEILFNEIEIINDDKNKNRPTVKIKNKDLYDVYVDVSISHIKEFATANAIVSIDKKHCV